MSVPRPNDVRRGNGVGGGPLPNHVVRPSEVEARRRLFWENVVRDMLTTLSTLRQRSPEMFDGRMSILTHAGERIPIANVFPMFACSIVGTQQERVASGEVASSIFRIKTPNGEVFTIPVSEVRALHALSPELVEALEEAARAGEGEEDSETQPFGFAAFRSISAPATPSLFDEIGGPEEGDPAGGSEE